MEPTDSRPRLLVRFGEEKSHFGLIQAEHRDPQNPAKFKRLNHDEDGAGGNCCLRIDGQDYLFGRAPGQWALNEEDGRAMKLVVLRPERRWQSVMDWHEQVRVTRLIRLVHNDQTGLLDTCLVVYTLQNHSNGRRTVGIRDMIDTYAGGSDGQPFAVPGQGLVATMRQFGQRSIPDFIQALEGDPERPGTVAQLGLRLPGLEPPLRLVLCRSPESTDTRWQWPYRPLNEPTDNTDSCVVLYWPELDMLPGEVRHVGYIYGLGRLGTRTDDYCGATIRLALTIGGDTRTGKVFTVMAYVRTAREGQSVTLRTPEGLSLVPGQRARLPVASEPCRNLALPQVLAWHVRADHIGAYPLTAELREGAQLLTTARLEVRVPARGLFDG